MLRYFGLVKDLYDRFSAKKSTYTRSNRREETSFSPILQRVR